MGNIVHQQYETTTRQQMNTTVDDLQDIARMCIFYLMFMLQYNTLCTVNPSNWKTANKRAWSKSFTWKEVAEALAVSDSNCSMEYYTCSQGHDLNDILLGQLLFIHTCKYLYYFVVFDVMAQALPVGSKFSQNKLSQMAIDP